MMQCYMWVFDDEAGHTFFLCCLYMASSASFIVTPFRFRAVTSSPSGKWRSIFLTGGVVRNFFKASLSSTVAGEVFSFLQRSRLAPYGIEWRYKLLCSLRGSEKRSLRIAV